MKLLFKNIVMIFITMLVFIISMYLIFSFDKKINPSDIGFTFLLFVPINLTLGLILYLFKKTSLFGLALIASSAISLLIGLSIFGIIQIENH